MKPGPKGPNKTSFKKGFTPWNKGKGKIVLFCCICNTKIIRNSHNNKPSKNSVCSIKCRGKLSSIRMKEDNPSKKQEVKDKIRTTLLQTYKKYPEILLDKKPSGKNQFSNYYTDIEMSIKNELDALKIPYEHNYKIGKYYVDFLIFDKYIIECDGEYWHNIKNPKEKDQKKKNFFCVNGMNVWIFTGKEIKNNANECVNIVLRNKKFIEDNPDFF